MSTKKVTQNVKQLRIRLPNGHKCHYYIYFPLLMPSTRSLGRLSCCFFVGRVVAFLFSHSRADWLLDFHRQSPGCYLSGPLAVVYHTIHEMKGLRRRLRRLNNLVA